MRRGIDGDCAALNEYPVSFACCLIGVACTGASVNRDPCFPSSRLHTHRDNMLDPVLFIVTIPVALISFCIGLVQSLFPGIVIGIAVGCIAFRATRMYSLRTVLALPVVESLVAMAILWFMLPVDTEMETYRAQPGSAMPWDPMLTIISKVHVLIRQQTVLIAAYVAVIDYIEEWTRSVEFD